MSALVDHIDSATTEKIVGTYRNDPAIHYLDRGTGLNVFTDPNGGFWGAWRLGQAQFTDLITTGGFH